MTRIQNAIVSRRHSVSRILWVVAALVATGAIHLLMQEQARIDAARQQELLLRTALAHADVAAVIADQGQNIAYVSPALAKLSGYTEAELVGQPITMLMPATQRQTHDELVARSTRGVPIPTADSSLLSAKRQVFCGLQQKDGKTLLVNIVGNYVDGGVALISPATPLLLQAAASTLALEALNAGIWWWDAAADRMVWDPKTQDIFGWSETDGWRPSLDGLLSVVAEHDRPRLRDEIDKALCTLGTFKVAVHTVSADGEPGTVLICGRAMRVAGREDTLLSGIVINTSVPNFLVADESTH